MDKTKNFDLIKELASEEFLGFCKNVLLPSLRPLEAFRYFIILAITVLISAEICFIWFYIKNIFFKMFTLGKDPVFAIFAVIMTAAITLTVCAMFCVELAKTYKKKAKINLYEKLFSYWGSFKYLPVNPQKSSFYNKLYGNIENSPDGSEKFENHIKNFSLFKPFKYVTYDDFITGAYNGLNIEIADLTLYEPYIYKQSEKRALTFSGLVVVCSCNKKFSGRTVIKLDKGAANSLVKIDGLEKVNLEDPVFESLYEVFSNDQVEARYLLTPTFMTRLAKADLRNKAFRITLSFENGTINMALPSAKDWFEFSLFKSVNDIRNLQTVLLELANILAIVDTLRMDENIGM